MPLPQAAVPAPQAPAPPDYEKLWRNLSVSSTRMQNMLNELGICDDCGRPYGHGAHPDPVAEGTCTVCSEPIGVMSSCCWSGPDAIWLHDETPEDGHEAAPREEDQRRAHEEATAEGGAHADPLGALRSEIALGFAR